MPWHVAEQCPQCALLAYGGQLCGNCIASSPEFDATSALFRYEYPLDSMLQRYKYGQSLTMADTFASLMTSTISTKPDLVIPMPLHPQRLQERGFNQSLEIARIIAQKMDIRLETTACKRIKLSPPQASLPLKQRVKNMKGAFSCDTSLDGLHVALLDDVMTTGASLNALAKAVKSAGARHVECWVVARTLPR
ncbi:MAG TPA: ComF family protein [Methylophilaceae bacterium]|nr:ComF family protein [Methylophilaceae bacterium]